MNGSYRTGFSFGITSGIITTLGLIVGLQSGTQSKLAVFGGILTIAIADAFSDSLGIHISSESSNHTQKQVWQSTFATFIAKFFFALSFLIPILLFQLPTAIVVSIFWGLFLLSILSYYIAKKEKVKPWKVILEHISIAVIVVIITHFLGILIRNWYIY